MVSSLLGMPVQVSAMLGRGRRVQCRFPRTTAFRVRKKWRRRQGNFKLIPEPQSFLMRDPIRGTTTLVCCPAAYELLQKASGK
jgi:hypothetical protein